MINLIKEKLDNADKIIVGLSGGADSIALTHILLNAVSKEKLICAHVNHLLRGDEAFRDEEFVKNFCKDFDIELKCVRIDINELSKKLSLGTEECARNARYDFFSSLCKENFLIATAHNADDNAETVILNLVRGSGLKGLCGIPAIRENIVRPILDMTRAEIEEYCKLHNLKYITDSTNLQNDYSRNKIRNLVFPILNEINEKSVTNITRTSLIVTEHFEHLNSQVENALKSVKCEYGISVDKLLKFDDYMKKEIIMLFLEKNFIRSYEQRHLNLILSLLEIGGAVNLPLNYIVSIKQGILSFYSNLEQKNCEIMPQIGKTYHLFDKKIKILIKSNNLDINFNNLVFTNFFDYDKIENDLLISARRDGDVFKPFGKRHKKSLKKLFNEAKIPSHLRNKLIIIRDKDEIVFIEKFGVSQKYAADEKTKNILCIEIDGVGESDERASM